MEKIRIRELTGDGYELGLKVAEIFRDNIDIAKKGRNSFDEEELEIVIKNIEKEYPEYLQEMYGRADRLQIDR